MTTRSGKPWTGWEWMELLEGASFDEGGAGDDLGIVYGVADADRSGVWLTRIAGR